MHKWLQLPATPTDDPLATVYPINHYKKSHVYAVTRINPIYVDDEHLHNGGRTWNNDDNRNGSSSNNNNNNNNKSGSSGYDSQPHSDHSSSLDKNSPPGTKCLRNGGGGTTTTPPPSSPSDGARRAAASWLSPIEEGVVDVRLFVPRPVWPDHEQRIPRAKCCRPYDRCRCLSSGSSGTSGTSDDGGGGPRRSACSYSGYSSAYGGSSGGGTISTGTTASGGDGGGAACSCSDDAGNPPSSGIGSVSSNQSPLALDPRFGNGIDGNRANLVANVWNSSVDLRLNQKTDNLHYDCDAMLRGLQFTLDPQQAEKLMHKIKVGKKHRCWCRLITTFIGLIMFLVSVITVTLVITKGKKMFGSI